MAKCPRDYQRISHREVKSGTTVDNWTNHWKKKIWILSWFLWTFKNVWYREGKGQIIWDFHNTNYVITRRFIIPATVYFNTLTLEKAVRMS